MNSKWTTATFLGTIWLMFGGCGSAVLAAALPQQGIGFYGFAVAFGLTVLTMACAIRHISGCHLESGLFYRPRGRKAVPHQRSFAVFRRSGNRRIHRTRRLVPNRERENGIRRKWRFRIKRLRNTLTRVAIL